MTDTSIKIPLIVKILGIAICMLLILIIVAGFSHNRLSKVSEELDYLASYVIPLTDTVTRVYEHVLEQELHFERMITAFESETGSQENRATELSLFIERGQSIQQALAEGVELAMESNPADGNSSDSGKFPEIVSALRRIAAKHQELGDHSLGIVDRLKKENNDEIQALVSATEEIQGRFDKEIDDIRRQLHHYNQRAVVRTRQHQRHVLYVNAFMTIIATMTSLLIASTRLI